MEGKKRADVRLIELGLATSRERAKEALQAGLVTWNHKKITKAGTMVPAQALLQIEQEAEFTYVGRGGLKLEKALSSFAIDVKGRVCLDAGASTGGFTDCLLRHGAAKVYAVDVGHDQLDPRLKCDPRVVSMEGVNVRTLQPETLGELCTLGTADLSFISLTKVLPALCGCLAEGAPLVCLVKPQFEAGKNRVGKKGVVKDSRVHRQVLEEVTAFAAALGLRPCGLTTSPIKGQEGNAEFLLYLQKIQAKGETAALTPQDMLARIHQVVQEACQKG